MRVCMWACMCVYVCVYIYPRFPLWGERVRGSGLEQISWYLLEWVSLRTPSQSFILGSSGPRLCLCSLFIVVLSRLLYLAAPCSHFWARSRAFACALRARRPFDAAGSSSFSTLSTSQLKCVSKGIRWNEKLSHANNLPQIFLTISRECRGYWIENSLRRREYFEKQDFKKI